MAADHAGEILVALMQASCRPSWHGAQPPRYVLRRYFNWLLPSGLSAYLASPDFHQNYPRSFNILAAMEEQSGDEESGSECSYQTSQSLPWIEYEGSEYDPQAWETHHDEADPEEDEAREDPRRGRARSHPNLSGMMPSLSGPIAEKPLYRPLNPGRKEIRVLMVKPGQPDDHLVCFFRYLSLTDEEHLPYYTISYCWATLRGHEAITVNGQKLTVTASSAAALRRVRLPDFVPLIWIDAVCINQQDLEERSQQVGMMSLIFSRTALNLVWLGEGDSPHLVEEAMSDIREEAHAYIRAERESYREPQSARRLRRHRQTRVRDDDFRLFARRLCGLFASPWFRRLWVCPCVIPPRPGYMLTRLGCPRGCTSAS
jgi:hypothetical protein